MKYYAVKKGRHPGIYTTWKDCQKEVDYFKDAKFKSFDSKEEALAYLKQNNQKSSLPLKQETINQRKQNENKISLSKDQYKAYQQLLSGNNVFLTGGAGTGKSFVLQLFINEMEKQNKNVIVCAPTGIAAINIQGVTIHRCFQVSPEPQVIKHIKRVPQVVKESDIIVIDEISMCRIDLFDFVVRTIMKAEENSLSRKQIVVVGDFFQLPPVTTDNDLEVLKEIYENYHKGYAFESTNWQDLNFQTVELKQVIRQKNPEFIHELNKARIGDYSCVSYFNTHCQKTLFENGIILTATNRKAEQINHDRLSKIPYKAKVYHSRIVGDVKNSDKPTLDELHLKIGARVMVLINDTEQNLYQNGSFGKVYKLEDESVTVILDTNKTLVTFSYHEWAIENYVLSKRKEGDIEDNHLSKEKVGAFYQIPLKLAYAITMHKSQGQTYDQVNLIPYSFDNGQLYVALSRVKSIEGLCLINQLRQENLICSQEVKDFYHIDSSKSKDKLIYELGKKVLNSHIIYPKEIQDLIDYIHKIEL